MAGKFVPRIGDYWHYYSMKWILTKVDHTHFYITAIAEDNTKPANIYGGCYSVGSTARFNITDRAYENQVADYFKWTRKKPMVIIND